MNDIMNDLEEISARIIDDNSIMDFNNNETPTLLEIFDSQLIEIALNIWFRNSYYKYNKEILC